MRVTKNRHIIMDLNILDIESFEEDNQIIPYCICLYINNSIFSLYYEDGVDIIIKSINTIVNNSYRNEIEIYVHNINFDGMLLINSLSKNYIKFEFKARNLNLYYIKFNYLNKKLIFRCSYKIIPISLYQLGKLEKQEKMLFPYRFVNRNNLFYIGEIPASSYWDFKNLNDITLFDKIKSNNKIFDLKSEIIKYCSNDVTLTYKVLKNMTKIIDLQKKNVLKHSFSSPALAYNIFFDKHNNFGINKNIKKVDYEYFKNAYYGGRTEVFANPNIDEFIKYYDFSGMYGQCMMEDFHFGDYKYYNDLKEILPGFHTILYNSENFKYPILPQHYKNKLIFSNGTKIGTFWWEEIKLFQNNGGFVYKILNSIVFNKTGKVFKDYVETFNKIRDQGGYYKIFAKLMINGLYGSMALKPENEFVYFTYSEKESNEIFKTMNISKFYKINEIFYFVIINDYKSLKYFKNKKEHIRDISYSAAISAKARIKLYNAFLTVIKDGGRLLYCDTDSIFAGYKTNNNSWKTYDNSIKWLEFYEDACFIAPKTYAYKHNNIETIKIKGISTKNIKFNEIKHKFYESNQNITFENQLFFKKKNFDIRQLYINKNIKLDEYSKRTFINDKKDTTPLTIHDDVF